MLLVISLGSGPSEAGATKALSVLNWVGVHFIANEFNISFLKKKNVLSLLSKVKLHSLASKSHTSMAVFIPILYVHTIFWCYYSWLIRFIQAVLRLSKEFGNTCLWIHSNWKVKWENLSRKRLSFDLIAHLEMEMVPKTLDVEDGSYQIYQY